MTDQQPPGVVDLAAAAARREQEAHAAAAAAAQEPQQTVGVTVTAQILPMPGTYNIVPISVEGQPVLCIVVATPAGVNGLYLTLDAARTLANALAQHAGGLIVAPAGAVPGTSP